MAKHDLAGQVAVITGAGSGIGRGLAQVLDQRGCKLALSDVNEAGLAETVASLSGEVIAERVDVSDREAVFAHAAAVKQRFGAADLVINNAGVDLAQNLADVSFEDFHWLMDINFWGVVHGTKAFLPDMLARGSGCVANISSIFGVVAWPGQGTYCAAKFAVRGFTESLRHELSGSGVRVLSVHPGGVATNIARNARIYGKGESDKEALIREFARVAKCSPVQAAETIVQAIEAGRERVLPGDGARFLDWLQRMQPVNYFRTLSRLGTFAQRRSAGKKKPAESAAGK